MPFKLQNAVIRMIYEHQNESLEIYLNTSPITNQPSDFNFNNQADDDGNTLMHHAFLAKNYRAVLLLEAAGVSLTTQNCQSLAPYQICFSMKNSFFQFLQQQIKQETNTQAKKFILNSKMLIESLYKVITHSSQLSTLAQNQFNTLSTVLRRDKNQEDTRVLVQFLNDPNTVQLRKKFSHWTPLMVAAFYNQIKVAKKLLAYGFDDQHFGATNETALTIALKEKYYSLAVLFILNDKILLDQNITKSNVKLPLLIYLISEKISPKGINILLHNGLKIDFTVLRAISLLKANMLDKVLINPENINELEQKAQKACIEQIFKRYLKFIVAKLKQDMIVLTAESLLLKNRIENAQETRWKLEAEPLKIKAEVCRVHLAASPDTRLVTVTNDHVKTAEIEKLNKDLEHDKARLEKLLLQLKSLNLTYDQGCFILGVNPLSHDQFFNEALLYLNNIKGTVEGLLDELVDNKAIFTSISPLKHVIEYLEEGSMTALQVFYYNEWKNRHTTNRGCNEPLTNANTHMAPPNPHSFS